MTDLIESNENWGIAGNNNAIRFLQRDVARGSLSHAYFFVGPANTGRRTAARRLAQALNCDDTDAPCFACDQCRRIDQGGHPDVVTVTIEDSAEGDARKSIGVDQVRSLSAQVALNPYLGRWRVAMIDPAEALSVEAQNALLITLEEPPAHVVLILIAANDELLLPTTLSRCSRLEFGLVSQDEIAAALRARGVGTDRAQQVARLSRGRPGWAIEAATDEALLAGWRESAREASSLPKMTLPERMALAEQLSDLAKRDRHRLADQVEAWATWWRDVLLIQCGASESVVETDQIEVLQEDGREYGPGSVMRFIRSLLETTRYLNANVQTRIALDALMMSVPKPEPTAR